MYANSLMKKVQAERERSHQEFKVERTEKKIVHGQEIEVKIITPRYKSATLEERYSARETEQPKTLAEGEFSVYKECDLVIDPDWWG